MRYFDRMIRARAVSAAFVCAFVAACASESSSQKSTTPANGGETHPAEWYEIGNARTDLQKSERDVDAAMSDCEAACKALASLERAVNHICAVADAEECNDARMRALNARKAVNDKCGGCR